MDKIVNEVTALSTQVSLKGEVKRTLDKLVDRVNMLSDTLEDTESAETVTETVEVPAVETAGEIVEPEAAAEATGEEEEV